MSCRRSDESSFGCSNCSIAGTFSGNLANILAPQAHFLVVQNRNRRTFKFRVITEIIASAQVWQFFVRFIMAFSVTTHGSPTFGHTVRILATIRTKRLTNPIHFTHTFRVRSQDFVKVVHAKLIVTFLTIRAISTGMAHGTLFRTIFGLTKALPMSAMQHRMTAIAIAPTSTLRIKGFAKLEISS